MEYFTQQLINGITIGSVYGLIAIGYTMVYGIIGMINFAHGDIYMVGAFVTLTTFLILQILGISFIPLVLVIALIASMFITAFFGWSVERMAYRPLRYSTRLAPLITAIGVAIVLQNYVQLTQGARSKAQAPLIEGSIRLFGEGNLAVNVSYLQIFIFLFTILTMIFFTFMIAKTPLGRSQRACQQDKKMASLLGINVDRTISITFVMGAALAAIAGFIVVIYYGVINFYIGFLAGIKAFTAAVLGGIGSIPGAMLGGLMIGMVEALWAGYFSSEYKDVAAFSILILFLIFRPTGLLGKPEVEKV